MANGSVDGKPKTARSIRGNVIDDNLAIAINIKWLGQFLVLVGGLLYAAWRIENRITVLEQRMAEANDQISELVSKHISEERIRYDKMEEELQWYQKELGLNLNPLSWKKKRKRK
jgi:uncharacterized coiled-coil protein SlyX|tara:strand:- start:776 stop:1120 length:345 start_codon:yes stop_codon:yes gene_type:complete